MADVIVIGGGIAGCSTARYLAGDGVDVLLLEQADISNAASGNNAGNLHAQIQHEPFVEFGPEWARGYAPVLRFLAYSIALWQEAAAELHTDIEVSIDGGLLIATDERHMRMIEAKAEIERAHGLDMQVLDRRALLQMAPYLSARALGAAYCPIEGKATPLAAGLAFAHDAQRRGARILRGQSVIGITRDRGEFEVATSSGKYRAPRVVNAAGIAAGRVASLLGASIDIQAFPIQLTVTEPAAPLVRHLVYSARGRLTMKQTHQGTVLIGGGWPARIDGRGRPQVSPESLSRNLAIAIDAIPNVASLNLVRSWAAIVNGTESWRPLLGELPGVPGFYINYVPWMGFTGGPGGGRIVASLVQGRAPPVDFDLAMFRP